MKVHTFDTQEGETFESVCARFDTLIAEAHEPGRFGNGVQVLHVEMGIAPHLWSQKDELQARYPKARIKVDKLGMTIRIAIGR